MIQLRSALLFIFILSTSISFSQEKYIEKKGILTFEASEKAFEPIKAKNESVTAILNITTGEFASLALIKEFRFRNALMEEHFNENYIESDSYPKAIFKGKIQAFDPLKLSKHEKEHKISGSLTLHGKKKNLEVPILISKIGNEIKVTGNFTVTPQHFDISIPKIVREKIAENVHVFIDFNLKAK